MDGNFTVNRANRFLETGKLQEVNSSGSSSITAPGLDAAKESGKSFSDTLNEAINSVNDLQKTADKGAQDLATGRTDNIHEVMIAVEKADIALKLMVQVRNKIIDAYQEVMKMQV
jgi:flagellar hook-basal body complex protein FliE